MQRFISLAIYFSGSSVAKSNTTQYPSLERHETTNGHSHDFTIILYLARDDIQAIYTVHETAIRWSRIQGLTAPRCRYLDQRLRTSRSTTTTGIMFATIRDLPYRIMLMMVNIFFPPLAVMMMTGLGPDTLLNSLLFLCAVIPSHVHGFYIRFVSILAIAWTTIVANATAAGYTSRVEGR